MNKTVTLLFLLFFSWAGHTQTVDYLVIGDSQLSEYGGYWGLGSFLQRCMKRNPAVFGQFAIYSRGGTVPQHWLNVSGFDHIETIYRDNQQRRVSLDRQRARQLGLNYDQLSRQRKKSLIDSSKKRLDNLISTHAAKKLIIVLGDNLIARWTPAQIRDQYMRLLNVIKKHQIGSNSCFFVTPTYEIIARRRAVKAKNLANTMNVINQLNAVARESCQVIDSLQLQANSSWLFNRQFLRRVNSAESRNRTCTNIGRSDNIHVCGGAAADWAERVCQAITAKTPGAQFIFEPKK